MVFAAERHPDTIDEQGPYSVIVRQVAGPAPGEGRLHYTVVARDGRRVSGQHALRTSAGGGFEGRIPGQPAGSRVEYWFSWAMPEGRVARHPGQPTSTYRFQVARLRVLDVRLPAANEADDSVFLRVEARQPPRAEAVVERRGEPQARSILAMSVQAEAAGVFRLGVRLPSPGTGATDRVYFRVAVQDETTVIPAGAPGLSFSLRRTTRRVRRLPASPGLVLSLAAAGEVRWVGTRGAGLWEGAPGAAGRLWTSGLGLPSGVIRFVLPDPVSGAVFVGTDRGLALREPSGPWHKAEWDASLGETAVRCSDHPCPVGPGALSSLDGSLLFQVEAPPALESSRPNTLPLLLREGRIEAWKPSVAEGPLAGLFTVSFDEANGCFLVGAGLDSSSQGIRPAVLRRCGDRDEVLWMAGESPAGATVWRRVTAVAPDVGGAGLLVALEGERITSGRRATVHALNVLSPAGLLKPVTKDTDTAHGEITALVAERSTGRVLVGTFGSGVLELHDGVLRRLPLPAAVPDHITALTPGPQGSLLIGTATGAFEVGADGTARTLGLDPAAGLPPDALPMDVSPRDGRVLLSSASSGLVELVRGPDGWQPGARLRPGNELPAGQYGDARYGQDGAIGTLLLGQGLVEWRTTGSQLLGRDQGLHSNQVLRLLARTSGGWWVAFAPLPFDGDAGAAVQTVVGGRVARTLPIADRGVATIGNWIELPDGRTVLAATRAGIVELSEGSPPQLRSREPLSAIARDAATGAVGAAGSAVGRWIGDRLVPVLFALDAGGRRSHGRAAGDPVDLAINRRGDWYLLYREGLLATLAPDGRLLEVLDAEDGIPPTARRLLAHPETGEVFVGSPQDGMVVIAPP